MVINQATFRVRPVTPGSSLEQTFWTEANLVAQDEITGARQLVRQRFDGHHLVALSGLAIIEAFGCGCALVSTYERPRVIER